MKPRSKAKNVLSLGSRLTAVALAAAGLYVATTAFGTPASRVASAAIVREATGRAFTNPASFLDLPAIRAGVSPAERGTISVAHALGVRDFGRIPDNHPVRVGLIMRYRNEAQLAQLTLAQGQRGSRYYHRFLTPRQFAEYFGADRTTYARTVDVLQRRGFRIVQTFANHSAIMADAPAALAERYFHTEIHQVFQAGPRDGVRYVNVTPGVVPAELRSAVVSVSGLHSIQTVRFPLRLATFHPTSGRHRLTHRRVARQSSARVAKRLPIRIAAATPAPITTSTPSAAVPGPDPTESVESPTDDYLDYEAYGPPIYANAYDFPVQHGYGGASNHAAGSVILDDFLDSDENSELTTFAIKRTAGNAIRRCTDPMPTAFCDGTENEGNPSPPGDPETEATLDAETIMSLAPSAPFVEYIAPQFNDVSIEFAYEDVISDNVVDAVNSSFGGCETDDPDFEYSSNYIAMEGAALGITFSASTGDTGATNCGQYAANGAPQTEDNSSIPSSDYYFTAVGGTDFFPITSCSAVGNASTTSPCYSHEDGWTFGGGGVSVFEPTPPWQATVAGAQTDVADTSTTGRNTPDVVFVADPDPPGAGYVIYVNGEPEGGGGTSLASPMFIAMMTEIDQVQGARNGWVNPSLYATFYAQNLCAGAAVCSSTSSGYAFRNLTGGNNGKFTCATGYNDACGLGSILGWELAGVPVYGTPGGATPLPVTTPTPTATPVVGASPTATPTVSPSPTGAPTVKPSPVGTGFMVTTIGGSSACAASTDGTGINACFYGPTGIAYVASAAVDAENASQSTTDNSIFVTDFNSGYLRLLDTTAGNVVTTENNTTWNAASQLTALGFFPSGASQAGNGGLYVLAAGDPIGAQTAGTQSGGNIFDVALPTTKNTTPENGINGVVAPGGIAFNGTTDLESAVVSQTADTFQVTTYGQAVNDTTNAATTLPTKGNYGIAYYPPTSADGAGLWYITDSGQGQVLTASDVPDAATITTLSPTLTTPAARLNQPKEITFLNSTGAFYIANCGGNNIVKLTPGTTPVLTVVAGDGGGSELNGFNTGAAFDCPFGITNDGTNLYVTDFMGNTVREITNVS